MIENLQAQRGAHLLKSFSGVEVRRPIQLTPLAFQLVDEIRKSGGTHSSGLVQQKVTVRKKDGSTYYAVRWVAKDTGKSPEINHPKYTKQGSVEENEGEKIDRIIHDNSLSTNEMVRKLVGMGIYSKQHLVGLTGHKYPADVAAMVKKEAGINTGDYSDDHPNGNLPSEKNPNNPVDLGSQKDQVMAISEIQEKMGEKDAFKAQQALRDDLVKKYGVTVGDKWTSYEKRLERLIVDGFPKAVMAYGTGGIGKTYTWEKEADKHKLIEFDPELDMEKGGEEYDFVKIGGKIGSREMQRAMYEHRNKILVFDDCDSMWNDEGLINVLKNVLDTSGNGKCQWAQKLPETQKGLGDEVPSSFKFQGRMVFITNLSKKELSERGASPITESRASSIDLTMSAEQTLERLQGILQYVSIKDYKNEKLDITEEDKKAALQALREIAPFARVEQLNTRTLGKIIGEARGQRKSGSDYDHRKLVVSALEEFGLV